MKLLILITALAVVNSKPQAPGNLPDDQTVQIEKQEVREIKLPESRTLLGNEENAKRAQSTKEILDKIVEVNRKHGLTPKDLKTNRDYINIPTLQRSGTAKQQQFQFPQNPFSNPIFDYLNINNDNSKSRQNVIRPTTFSAINTNAEVNPDDNIPGQFIKRKITHHQTFIVPVEGGMNGNYFGQMQNMWYPNQPSPQYTQVMQQNPPQAPQLNPLQPPLQSLPQPQNGVANSSNSQPDSLKKTLENQTVENIKNIVNTQLPPQAVFNPYTYAQSQMPAYFQSAYPFYAVPRIGEKVSETQPLSSNSYRINGLDAKIPDEFMLQQLTRPGRQWQWPLAQYFPIVIKDPLQQIFNAFTSMVEYGQDSSAHCADEQKRVGEVTSNTVTRLGKNLRNLKVDESTENLHNLQDENKRTAMDIENLEMTESTDNPMKLTVKFSTSPDMERPGKESHYEEPLRVNTKISQFPKTVDTRNQQSEAEIVLKGLINAKDKRKGDGDNQKFFSKDNTGSGVFIHKLRVRKGGVAIAGPGGIATAGSGGTAIVGPNGYAYTQPDSLAIAGSGTKIIAVDPGVNLSDLIESVKKDKTGAIDTRLGKIVAIGPTIYYNKG